MADVSEHLNLTASVEVRFPDGRLLSSALNVDADALRSGTTSIRQELEPFLVRIDEMLLAGFNAGPEEAAIAQLRRAPDPPPAAPAGA